MTLFLLAPVNLGNDPHFYGVISVSRREALWGVRKFVNIAHGFKKRTFWIKTPPGISEGSKLRLRGMDRQMPDGVRGDLYLKVRTRD